MKRYGLKTNVILITRYDANIKRGQGLIRIGRRQQMSAVFNFARKKILVTGASQGIGYALSLALAQSGAEVYALSNVGKGLDDLCKKSSRITKITFDLCSSEEELREVLSPYQPFDCLVNNAGIAILEEFGKIMESTISNTFALNYKACLLLSQVVSLEMIKHKVQGSIVNVSSQCSLRPLWSHAVYCSSKAALDMATRCMAKELGAHGIRVNAVNPTVVMTEMGRQNWSDSQKASAMLDQMCIKRFAEVDDVINGVMFLLSDISAMTTGSTLAVDGGFTNIKPNYKVRGWAHILVSGNCSLDINETNADIEEQVMASSYIMNNTIVVILGATDTLPMCNQSTTIEHALSPCGTQCGNNGKCRINKKGTPIENYECLCNYGYRGIHCEEKMRTKFVLMYFFWVVVVFEITLIFVGVTRFTKRHFFEPRIPPQRFVDKLRRRAHQQKLNTSNNVE